MAGQGERRLLGLSPTRSLFSRLQKDLCWAHLPRLFSAAVNCFLSPHSQVVSAAAQTLEVPHTGASPHLAALGLVGGSAQGFGTCWGVVCPSVPARLGDPWSTAVPFSLFALADPPERVRRSPHGGPGHRLCICPSPCCLPVQDVQVRSSGVGEAVCLGLAEQPLPGSRWGLAGLVCTLIAAGSVPASMSVSSLLPRLVEEGLTYRFHAAWDEVLRVLEVFFETCGKQCHPIMRKVSQAGRAQTHPWRRVGWLCCCLGCFALSSCGAGPSWCPLSCLCVGRVCAALGVGTGTRRAAGIPGQAQ